MIDLATTLPALLAVLPRALRGHGSAGHRLGGARAVLGRPAAWRYLVLLGLALANLASAGDELMDDEPSAGEPRPVIQAVAFGVAGLANPNATQSPLFAATDALGVPEKVAVQLSEVFAEEIDFHRDLERGYLCTLVYEMYYPDGVPTAGRILAARFLTPERRIEAYLFPLDAGAPIYFDDQGLDVNKTLRLVDPEQEPWLKTLSGAGLSAAFRRSPLEFSRITSLPSAARYHPILKEWRAHRGTDYGAPIGTGVRATAEGVVTFAGPRGNYGNLIELRHFDRYTTRYGHLSGFASGLAAGKTVAKGEVIGRVGMTGLATGPHLHYELHSDNGASPPDRLAFAIRAVPPARQAEFEAVKAPLRRKLAFAERANRLILRWPALTPE